MIFFSYLLLVLALICLDQWLKIWVSTNIALNHSQHFIPGVMDLTNLHNYGAAWSMFQGQQLFFSIVTVVVIAGIGYCFWRFRHRHPILLCLSWLGQLVILLTACFRAMSLICLNSYQLISRCLILRICA